MKRKLLGLLVLILLAACDKEDGGILNFQNLSISVGEKKQLTQSKEISFAVGNNFIAEIDSKRNLVGKHVGWTYVYAVKGGYTEKNLVEVTPKYKTFEEPVLEFGKSMDFIMRDEKRILLGREENRLLYEGENEIGYYIYYFFVNGSMVNVQMIFDIKDKAEIINFLLERYQQVNTGTGSDRILLLNDKAEQATIGIDVFYNKPYMTIVYHPNY